MRITIFPFVFAVCIIVGCSHSTSTQPSIAKNGIYGTWGEKPPIMLGSRNISPIITLRTDSSGFVSQYGTTVIADSIHVDTTNSQIHIEIHWLGTDRNGAFSAWMATWSVSGDSTEGGFIQQEEAKGTAEICTFYLEN